MSENNIDSTENSKPQIATDIIGYSFGYGAEKESAGFTPRFIQQVMGDILQEKGVINNWLETEVPTTVNREKFIKGSRKIRNEAEVFSAVKNLADAIAHTLWAGRIPLILGGDHSQGCATIKATLLVDMLKEIKNNNRLLPFDIRKQILDEADGDNFAGAAKLIEIEYNKHGNGEFKESIDGILDKVTINWADSHADFNNPEISDSCNLHGQSLQAGVRGKAVGPFSSLYGSFVRADPKNVYVFGTRDLDENEIMALNGAGVNYAEYSLTGYGKSHLDYPFSDTVLAEIQKQEDAGKTVIFSFDTDVTLGQFVAGTGTPMGLVEGSSLPLSGVQVTDDMIRPNFAGESPSGPGPMETYKALKGSARKRSTDLTEISGIITIENKQTGKKDYVVDYSGIVVGIKQALSALCPEGRQLYGKNGIFREMAVAIAEKFSERTNPECWLESVSGDKKFSIKPLIDTYFNPIIENLKIRDKRAEIAEISK